jgi:hypothetical protein
MIMSARGITVSFMKLGPAFAWVRSIKFEIRFAIGLRANATFVATFVLAGERSVKRSSIPRREMDRPESFMKDTVVPS